MRFLRPSFLLPRALLVAIPFFLLLPVSADSSNPAVQALRELHAELDGFKYSTEFRQVGYGVCCEYHAWRQRVLALEDQAPYHVFVAGFGLHPVELVQLGQSYYRGDMDHVAVLERRIAAVRSPVSEEPSRTVTEPDGVLGSWRASGWPLSSSFTTFRLERSDGQLTLHTFFDDGSSAVQTVRELKPRALLVRRFAQPDSQFGEYFGILADGSFAYYDTEGLIFSASVQ